MKQKTLLLHKSKTHNLIPEAEAIAAASWAAVIVEKDCCLFP